MKNKTIIYLVIGFICAILTYGIAIQVRTVNSFGTSVGNNNKQNELKSEVLKMKEKSDNLYKNIEKAEKNLEKERNNATKNNDELSAVEEEIKKANILLGVTDVTGPGLVVRVQDSNISTLTYMGDPNDLLVHDADLINIVNELFNAGAEAVSINGQRIVSNTAIECEGNVVKINGVKVGNPFEIKAIGYPEQLSGISRAGGYLDILKRRGVIVTSNKEEKVKINKYTGTLKFNYVEK